MAKKRGPAASGGKGAPSSSQPARPDRAQPPAALAPAAPGAPGGAAAGAGGDDEPCFEFRQVIDENGNPVLRKVQVPCPEK
jgi:hypothetical protein